MARHYWAGHSYIAGFLKIIFGVPNFRSESSGVEFSRKF